MLIDLRMLIIAGAVLALLQTFGMAMLWRLNRRLPGIAFWTASTTFYAVSSPFFAMREMDSSRFLWFVMPNVLSAAAPLFFYLGACRFTGRPIRLGLVISVHLIGATVFWYFLYVKDSQVVRMHLMSMVAGLSFGLAAMTLWREKRPGLKFSTRFTAVTLGVGSCSMIYRLLGLWGANPPKGYIENFSTNWTVTIFAIAMAYFWTFCVMLLVNQHQAQEISERMTAQFSVEEELLKAKHEVEKQRALRLRQLMVRDLHDGIGGITANLAMMASLGREERGNEREELLQRIETMAIEGSREVRSMMNLLENGVFRWTDWLGDFRDYARKVTDAGELKLGWKVSGNLPEGLIADTPAAISLMRALKEAIHNVARHANARSAMIAFEFSQTSLEITIQDDGVGFKKAREGGHGLKNMRHRVEEFGGSFTINGGEGTTIVFTIPLPLKYAEEKLV